MHIFGVKVKDGNAKQQRFYTRLRKFLSNGEKRVSLQIGRWKHVGCNDCNEAPADLSKLYVAMATTSSSPTKVAHFIGSNHLMDTHLNLHFRLLQTFTRFALHQDGNKATDLNRYFTPAAEILYLLQPPSSGLPHTSDLPQLNIKRPLSLLTPPHGLICPLSDSN